ncbi:MAG: MarR family transcriptional regulator [Proteobacteria bacterium]|nr:MarR family transcriptional regulator [Pseudomonadota bacterium]
MLKDQLGLFSGKKKPATAEAPAPVEAEAPAPEPVVEPVVEPVPAASEAPSPAPVEDAEPPKPIPGRPGEHYLFPPERKRPRKDLHFSRRMSDLVRRLQLLEREHKQHLDLTLPQSHALHALMEAGSLRMQELAASLGLAQSTVTRLVAPLKRMGLLDRRPDRNDGRATRAFLTEKGTAIVDELETADRGMYQGLLERLDPTRRAEVIAAVELLHEAVLDITWEDQA